MDTKKAVKVSNKFRQSAAGVKLGRALFDPNLQLKLNPNQIANILRQIGIPIPQEVQVGLQTAQLIMSGGALVSSISTAQSILQISQASVSTLNAAMGVLQAAGLLDANSIFCRTVQTATDAAIVINSGGTNVLADISLVMDIVAAIAFAPDERPQVRQKLDQMNAQKATSWIKMRTQYQLDKAQSLIANYQDKKISMFEFIGEFAIQAGDAFPNYFPEYKAFIPPKILDVTFSSYGEANYGGFLFIGRQTDVVQRDLTLHIQTTQGITHKDLVRGFVAKFITDPFSPYFMLNAVRLSQNTIPFHVLACLSVLSDDFDYVPQNFNIIPTLQKLLLSPSDLQYPGFIDAVTNDTVKDETYAQSGISINGVPLNAKAAARNKKVELDNYSRKLALKYDAEGDILSLTKIPLVGDILRKWGRLPDLNPVQISKLPTLYKTIYDAASKYNVTGAGANFDYRNIQNFFSAVSLMDLMRHDSWLNQNGDLADALYAVKGIIPLRDEMENFFRDMFFLSTARHLNIQARGNVASFFQTTPEKVEFKNKPDGTAYVVPKG